MKWFDQEKKQKQIKKEFKFYKIYLKIVFKNLNRN